MSKLIRKTLRIAIRSARFQAARERRVTSLSFDGEAGTLIGGGESFQLNSNFGKEGRGETFLPTAAR